jgi:hypothetical protein
VPFDLRAHHRSAPLGLIAAPGSTPWVPSPNLTRVRATTALLRHVRLARTQAAPGRARLAVDVVAAVAPSVLAVAFTHTLRTSTTPLPSLPSWHRSEHVPLAHAPNIAGPATARLAPGATLMIVNTAFVDADPEEQRTIYNDALAATGLGPVGWAAVQVSALAADRLARRVILGRRSDPSWVRASLWVGFGVARTTGTAMVRADFAARTIAARPTA